MNPRVFVQVWCEIDPTLNLRVDRQTGVPRVDAGDELMRVSPLGRAGIAEALRLPHCEVTAFAVGAGHDLALRHALAAGATHAVQLTVREVETSGPRGAVGALARWLADQSPGLVLADRLAGQVAARLGWSHLAGLEQLQVKDGALVALRQFGRGAQEQVSARLPAIVRLQAAGSHPPYVAQARLQRADLLPIVTTVIDDAVAGDCCVLESGPAQVARPRTHFGAARIAAPAKASDRLNALMGLASRGAAKPAAASKPEPAAKSPRQMAEEFVRYLAHHQLLGDS